MIEQITTALQTTLSDMIQGTISFIPLLIIGFIIVFVGYVIARILRTVITRLTKRIGLDDILERAGMTSKLRAIGMSQTPSEIVASLVYYVIMLNFLLAAFRSMGMSDAVEPLVRIIEFIPTAIAGLITFVIGVLLAQFLGNMVSSTLDSIGIDFHQVMGSLVQGLVITIVAVVVMEQIGLEASILTTIISSVVIVIIAGLALAFGLGGQSVTKNVLAGFYSRELFSTGDVVIIDGEEGVLEGIGTLNAEIRMGADRMTIPNTRLTEGSIRRRE